MGDSVICACSDKEWCPVFTEINDTLYRDLNLFVDSTLSVDSDVDCCKFELNSDSNVHYDLVSDVHFDYKLNSDVNIELPRHSSTFVHLVSGIAGVHTSEMAQIPKFLPSIQQLPELELESLLAHLKYTFLEVNEQLPVIVANNLLLDQEEKLLSLLKVNKKGIGWTLAYIVGISPFVCMHRILLEEDAKPVR